MKRISFMVLFLSGCSLSPCLQWDSSIYGSPQCVQERADLDKWAALGRAFRNDSNAYVQTLSIDHGSPSTTSPSYSGNNGNFGNAYIQTPNAYGPGIHMDQYGRPVQVVPQF